MRLLSLVLLLFFCLSKCHAVTRNFTVDYTRDTFLKDGEPFRYISGCMHYFRVPRYYWRDRLAKMKACGLDAVETYIPWNFHWVDSEYNFSGQRDIIAFLQMIHDEGLLAIVRGFPFSDTEWDMGGLPSWLLKSKINSPEDPMILRTSDPKFVSAVRSWLDVIMPILKPHLYNNGGPIIMLQVENEYGSYYARDTAYLKTLYHDIDSRLDKNVLLFTTDGNGVNYLENGIIDGVFTTVDFGPGTDVNASFSLLRKYQPNGPLVNSEFYTGWLDHWGEPNHHRRTSTEICTTFDQMLAANASVNFYMFTGGTNFEYWSGSNGPPISQITTSYDYDSPISENGDTTEKYFKIHEVISKYKSLPPLSVPANISTISYGEVELINRGSFWDHLSTFCPNGAIPASSPSSFEDLDVVGGYVLYRTKVPPNLTDAYRSHFLGLIIENSVRDAATVYINQVYQGELTRGDHVMELGFHNAGDQIDILVESRGRLCYGTGINDTKGMDGKVKLIVGITGEVWLTEWEMYPLTLENLDKVFDMTVYQKAEATSSTPSIYSATMYVSVVADTFLDLSGGNWTSGYVLVNGFNLGKFEPQKGPQVTLYLPTKSLLGDDKTLHITVFETRPSNVCNTPGRPCGIKLIDRPKIG